MILHFDALWFSNWASEVKIILAINGFSCIWKEQSVTNEVAFIWAFEQRIKDQFLQTWYFQISSSQKLLFYMTFTNQQCLDTYLDILKLSKFRHAFSVLGFLVMAYKLKKEDIGRRKGRKKMSFLSTIN